MKTNVPFQAPGINNPPRGAAQERGTSPKEVFKNVKKQIKENAGEGSWAKMHSPFTWCCAAT
jgi:hypothetical protein